MAADARLGRRVVSVAIFLGLAAVIVFFRLLPIETMPEGLPGPDLLLCLVLAWTIRRPDLLPVWLIGAVMLAADLLMLRPPGLGALLVVLATEWLRRRDRWLRSIGFGREMVLAAAICCVLVVANWFILSAFLVVQPPFRAQLTEIPVTLAAYPLVALFCRQVLGLRRRPVAEGFGRGARA